MTVCEMPFVELLAVLSDHGSMNTILTWIKKHRIFSIFAMAIAIGGALFILSKSKTNANILLTEPLKKGDIVESVYGIGTVTATKTYQIRSGVTSTVVKLLVREGDQVKKGDKLIVMDPSTVFSAPFDGTITFLPVKIGENVFPQAVLMSVVDLSDRYLVVTLEQQGALRVRQGQKAKLSFDSLRNASFEGTVESVYSHDNNFLVRIKTSDLPAQILPGMTVDVSIGISERKNVLLAPVAAIEDGKVYVQKGSRRLTPVVIKMGIVDGSIAELISDEIHEGDILAIRHKVRP